MSDFHPSQSRFTPANSAISLNRLGYGAMQLAGPHVWGPPKDRAAAVAVLREAIELGVNHIDTSDFYGPYVTNEIIKEALHPYVADLIIVTKVGFRRGDDQSWLPAASDPELVEAVHSNLRNLGLETLDVVNLRSPDAEHTHDANLIDGLETLLRLKKEGLIRHIGLSNVNARQLAVAQTVTEIFCVQNQYNLAHRGDDALIDALAAQDIAYVPFFPLGGFTPLQSAALTRAAESLHVSTMQLAIAWLLQRSPNILLIPGTSSVAHLRENIAAGALTLDAETLSQLDRIGIDAKK